MALWNWVEYHLLIQRLELKCPVGKFENKYASLYYAARATITMSHKPGGLKQTSKKSFFMVLETKSLKSRCQQDHAASEVLGTNRFSASLLVSGGSRDPWHPLACSFIIPVSDCIPPWPSSISLSLSVYLCANFLLIRTPVTETFLGVQWLKCWASCAGGAGSILDATCCAVQPKEIK